MFTFRGTVCFLQYFCKNNFNQDFREKGYWYSALTMLYFFPLLGIPVIYLEKQSRKSILDVFSTECKIKMGGFGPFKVFLSAG